MKNLKYAAVLLAALAMLMTACSQPAQPSPAASASMAAETDTPEPSAVETTADAAQATAAPAALTEDDIAFTLDGVQYRIKTDIQPLLDALGPDYEMEAAPSCLFVGEDKTFTYQDVMITTNPIDGKDIIDEIDLTSDKYSTARGIRVGDTPEQVKAAYGENCTDDGYIITYFLSGVPDDLKSPQLYFEITDGKVVSIGYYGASNING